MYVPDNCAGRVIGPKGTKLKKLGELTRTVISVPPRSTDGARKGGKLLCFVAMFTSLGGAKSESVEVIEWLILVFNVCALKLLRADRNVGGKELVGMQLGAFVGHSV